MFIFKLWLKNITLLFPLCLIHFDSFTENVKLTSAPFSDVAPQGVGGVETASDTWQNSSWPVSASVHVMKIHELPLSLKVSRIFQFLYVNDSERKASLESQCRGHCHLCSAGEVVGASAHLGQRLIHSRPCSGCCHTVHQRDLHERVHRCLLALLYSGTSHQYYLKYIYFFNLILKET